MSDDAVEAFGDMGSENGTRGMFYDTRDLKTINTRQLADRLPEEDQEEFLAAAGGNMDMAFILQCPTLAVSYAKVAPGVAVKPHHHNRNQITYVLSGSLFYGRREAKAGCGYFTPKKHYTWKAGPEGAEFLEITDGPPEMPITAR